jgi:N-methylhydantoinase B
LEREPERVAKDVREGLVSPTRARERYGVAIGADGDADIEETAALRSGMLRKEEIIDVRCNDGESGARGTRESPGNALRKEFDSPRRRKENGVTRR